MIRIERKITLISASIGGIACAAYTSPPPRKSLISFKLQKIAHFWIGNLSVPFIKQRMGTIYGHYHIF